MEPAPCGRGWPCWGSCLAGGFTTNFVWCATLNLRNRSYGEYLRIPAGAGAQGSSEHPALENPVDAASTEMALEMHVDEGKPSLGWNYLFSALAGAAWYMQFFFYTMGETQMGRYKFSSWTLHMASIIIFSTLWGIALNEWRRAGGRTRLLVAFSLLLLVSSTVIVGYGNYIGGASH